MNETSARLETIARCLLAFTCVFFAFVPQYERTSIWGEWYSLGFPFESLALKIGYLSPTSPHGLHFLFDPGVVLNASLWFGVYYGWRRLARAGFLSPTLAVAFASFAFLTSGLWFTYGTARVVRELLRQSK